MKNFIHKTLTWPPWFSLNDAEKFPQGPESLCLVPICDPPSYLFSEESVPPSAIYHTHHSPFLWCSNMSSGRRSKNINHVDCWNHDFWEENVLCPHHSKERVNFFFLNRASETHLLPLSPTSPGCEFEPRVNGVSNELVQVTKCLPPCQGSRKARNWGCWKGSFPPPQDNKYLGPKPDSWRKRKF